MKNLTHYFQVSKSPSDEPPSGSDAATEEKSDSKQKNEEVLKKVSKKSTVKPKKLSLKSKKSQIEADSIEKSNSKSSIAVSPDSTVNTSEKKKRKQNEIKKKTPEKEIESKVPEKSFASSMQNILQSVFKKKFPDESNGEKTSVESNSKNCVKTSDSVESDSEEVEILDETCSEISSSIAAKPAAKKRGRKPKDSKNESNDTSAAKKLSYEELENELIKERLLIAKLKETFLAQNPDALAKYNSTLSPKRKVSLNNSSEVDELLCTPKLGKSKLSNGDTGSKSTGNKPKLPKRSVSTPKSLNIKNSELLNKSASAKNTPENNTQIMKEVLEYLDHNESKTATPSPKKTSPKSKSSQNKDKPEAKSKKQLEFFKIGEKTKDKKENEKDPDESEEILSAESKKKTGSSPKKLSDKKTESPSVNKRKSKKSESADGEEELLSPGRKITFYNTDGEEEDLSEEEIKMELSSAKKQKRKKKNEAAKIKEAANSTPERKNVKNKLDDDTPKQEKELPSEKKRKRKKQSESTDIKEKSLGPDPVSPEKKRKRSVKSSMDKEKEEDKKTESVSEKKRQRKKRSKSSDNAEVLTVSPWKTNVKCSPIGGNQISNSPRKRSLKAAKKKEMKEVEETSPTAVKKKANKKSSLDNKKTRKSSLSKKPNAKTKSSIAKDEKMENKETVDLDSSSDSIFVSSQKAKDVDSSSHTTPKSKSKSKTEKESSDTKTSKTDSVTVDSSQKNSLLNYFGKVGKTFMKKEERSSALTTKAIVHSPPVSPSRKRKSSGPVFSPRRKKLKSMLAVADKIELLSSEIVANADCEDSNDLETKDETEKPNTQSSQSKPSPKKWSMRVKLAVQSPLKSSPTGEDSCSAAHESASDESSPESKVKRKLFGSKPKPVKEPDASSCNSADVEIIEENSEDNTNEKEAPSKKNSSAIEGKEEENLTPSSKEKDTSKPPVKLASIFLKKSATKTNSSGTSDSPIVIDEESVKAKKEFLSSGVPDIIKQKSEQSKALEKLEEEEYFVPFPKVEHVGYISLPAAGGDSLSELEKIFKLRPITSPMEIVNDCLKKSWKNIVEPANQIPVKTDDRSWTKCNDIKRQQRYLKKQASNFSFEAFEKKFEKNVSTEQKSSDKNQEMWTEKYKPQCSQEVLGNGACVTDLKQWLEVQKASKKKDSDGSSSDEFMSSDDDSSLSKRANNVAILTGPPGCGKTSSVYAVAKELGCKVLELNASYDRNGKKVLTELLEATQSHQVKQSNVLVDMFSKANKKSDKKKKMKELKKKLKEGRDSDSKVMSIILIEDADVIFSDYDDGFIAALSSLSTLSKRPIILVANDVRCSHLSKFIKQQCLLLEYRKPSFADIRTWLQLVALYEAVELPSNIAEKIVYETKDVRQAMLNLQYHLLSSRKPQVISNVDWPLDIGKLWWQWPSPFMIPPLTITTVKQSKPLVLESATEMLPDNNESVPEQSPKPLVPSPEDCLKFHKLVSFIDNLAFAEILSSTHHHTVCSEDPSPKSWHVKSADSCLLNERNSFEHAGLDSTSVALSHELISRHVCYLDLKFTDCAQNGISPDLARWKEKHKKVEKILLTGLPLTEHINRGSVFCDYLPMIRSISRSECLRLAGNSKRSNRFFNYLSSLNMHPDERQRTLLCNSLVFVNETAANS